MGVGRYRRARTAEPGGSLLDSSDPYAAYLSWVSEGRPSLDGGGSAFAMPEAGTVRLIDHVQVQEFSASKARPSRWRRLTEAFRRDLG